MFLYRDHKGSLAESMATVKTFETKQQLVDYLQASLDELIAGRFDCREIKVEPYSYDERIAWDTHIVTLDGFGVLGFTNGLIET